MGHMDARSDVVGSLLRPRYLTETGRQRDAGEIGTAAFKAVEERAVDGAIQPQEAAGLEVVAEPRVRVKEASAVVPLDRLALSPQCGFASTWEGNRVTDGVQRRKLELVAATAQEVWA